MIDVCAVNCAWSRDLSQWICLAVLLVLSDELFMQRALNVDHECLRTSSLCVVRVQPLIRLRLEILAQCFPKPVEHARHILESLRNNHQLGTGAPFAHLGIGDDFARYSTT